MVVDEEVCELDQVSRIVSNVLVADIYAGNMRLQANFLATSLDTRYLWNDPNPSVK